MSKSSSVQFNSVFNVQESRAENVLTRTQLSQLVQHDELLQRYKLQALKLKKVKGNTFYDLIEKVALRCLDNWNCATFQHLDHYHYWITLHCNLQGPWTQSYKIFFLQEFITGKVDKMGHITKSIIAVWVRFLVHDVKFNHNYNYILLQLLLL